MELGQGNNGNNNSSKLLRAYIGFRKSQTTSALKMGDLVTNWFSWRYTTETIMLKKETKRNYCFRCKPMSASGLQAFFAAWNKVNYVFYNTYIYLFICIYVWVYVYIIYGCMFL